MLNVQNFMFISAIITDMTNIYYYLYFFIGELGYLLIDNYIIDKAIRVRLVAHG